MSRWILLAALVRIASGGDPPEPRFYYDLGPRAVDVADYPPAQRRRYAVFARVCARCHTLARPINSPLASRGDWRRYVRRMSLRAAAYSKPAIGREEADEIVEFLTYDAQRRKLDAKADFERHTVSLKAAFADAGRDARRRREAEDRLKARP